MFENGNEYSPTNCRTDKYRGARPQPGNGARREPDRVPRKLDGAPFPQLIELHPKQLLLQTDQDIAGGVVSEVRGRVKKLVHRLVKEPEAIRPESISGGNDSRNAQCLGGANAFSAVRVQCA